MNPMITFCPTYALRLTENVVKAVVKLLVCVIDNKDVNVLPQSVEIITCTLSSVPDIPVGSAVNRL